MEKKIWVAVLALLTVAAFSTLAIADDECCCKDMMKRSHEKMMGGMQGKMEFKDMFFQKIHLIKENAAELGVTDEQLQKIMVIKASTEKSLIKNNADIEILAIDFEDALGKDEIDLPVINSIIDKKYALKAQETKTIVSAMADIKKFISKDQMKKMHELWEKEMMEGSKCMMGGDKKEMMKGMKDKDHKMDMSK